MNVLSISDTSDRSTHAYLPFMAKAADKDMLLCGLHLDGCSLERHWNNWRKELPCYEYDVCLPRETETRTVDDVALHEAVEDEEWDVITLRQTYSLCCEKESYTPYLAELAEYCRMMQPKAKILLIQPWICETSPLAVSEMYAVLTESCAEAAIESDIDTIVPVGKAWEIARQTPLGNKLTYGGHNASELGCYLAGACLYENIFGESIANNPFTLPVPFNEAVPLMKLCVQTAGEKGILR